ncbi:MAG: nucleoside hydrolase [Verrucomicrobiales bacterium]|nr:nucleoside hydrolase [Verrucomicrobiales bacterium]
MKIPLFLTALLGLLLSPLQAEPVKIIFDTDMGNDIDDAMALVMIHNLAKRDAVELLAVTSTKDHPLSAAYIDAVNTYYGFPDIPIGVVHDGATQEVGRYNEVATRTNEDGTLRYPHDLKSGEEAPEAVALIRKTLAAQPDESVKLVQVGFFTNFSRLLDSTPDKYSNLDGKALIKAKVKELVIMAGAFQTIRYGTQHLEYNVVKDIPSAQKLAAEWPTPVVWSGFEIGLHSTYPWKSIVEDYNYIDNHLLKDSYLAWAQITPHDRPTWDLSCVLHAIYPDRDYFYLSPKGSVTVNDEGRTDFSPAKKNGKDAYLIMSNEQAARLREAYVQLCTQPPSPVK